MSETFRIPLARPDVGVAEKAAVAAVLESPNLSRGPVLTAFEQDFRHRLGCGHAIGLSSGTAALHLALLALKAGPGDEVITVPYTVPATVNAILAAGARPVLVDIEAESRALDPARLETAIGERSRAVIVVHPFGQAAAIGDLSRRCRDRGVALIEDACEAPGGTVNGKALGTFGAVGCFGFYPNKQMTSGEGGMAVTADAGLADRIRLLANHGRRMNGRWLDQVAVGFNYRLSELSAALGRAQFQRLDQILETRRRLAGWYHEALAVVAGLALPPLNAETSWFAFVIGLPERLAARRDALAAHLAKHGIQTGRYFAPLHLQPGLEHLGYRPGDFPVAESVAAASLALPFFNAMTKIEVTEVAERIHAWVARQA